MARSFALRRRATARVMTPLFAALTVAGPSTAMPWRVDDAGALAPGACAWEAAAQAGSAREHALLVNCGTGSGEWGVGHMNPADGEASALLQWKRAIGAAPTEDRGDARAALAVAMATRAGAASQQIDEWSAHLAVRLPRPANGPTVAHANLGIVRAAGDRVRPQAGMAVERALDPRTTLVAEWHRVSAAPATWQLGLRRTLRRASIDVYTGRASDGVTWTGLALAVEFAP